MQPVSSNTIQASHHTSGTASGDLLYSDTALSFWGGVNPMTGEIIDRHHPLSGQSLVGKMLALPEGRGSCTGSSVLLELILNGHGPAALILQNPDEILILGALIAEMVFEHPLPVVSIGKEHFENLRRAQKASIDENGVLIATDSAEPRQPIFSQSAKPAPRLHASTSALKLNESDTEKLQGKHGKATQTAMKVVLKMAQLQGASALIDVVQAHIDGCIYTGSASLRFANQLKEWGGKVCVPTTLNSISVDQRCWRKLGVDPAFGEPASALADAYVAMGCAPSFTCAPYLLDSAPTAGQNIVWAESNAVVYANSVIGARTAKYADFLDICIALTGRAPNASCHINENRFATLGIQLPADLQGLDDAFYPLLGYWVGLLSGAHIPVISGLEAAHPNRDDLKAFGAAFATTSAAPMFHIVGVTPEAPTVTAALGGKAPKREHLITFAELERAWHELNGTEEKQIDLVALGNPHFSATEFSALAQLVRGKKRHAATQLVITTSQAVFSQAKMKGDIAILEDFGASILTDTCWCMINEPIVPIHAKTMMTNSGKYAHYGPGLTGRAMRFGSLAQCAHTAESGQASDERPAWLTQH